MFHLPYLTVMSIQHSYTFSSINVPYSVGEKESIPKTVIKHEVWTSGWELLSITTPQAHTLRFCLKSEAYECRDALNTNASVSAVQHCLYSRECTN